VLHGLTETDQDRIVLPILQIDVLPGSSDLFHHYCTVTKQSKKVLLWKVDNDESVSFARKKLERPKDDFAVEHAFNILASFRPLPPLSLRTVIGTFIAQFKLGHTALFLSESC
jgi:hypothetical protein